MGNFKNKFFRFISGRYGIDEFGKFLVWTYIILVFAVALIDIFVNSIFLHIIRFLLSLIALYAIWRMFSRNIHPRRNENEKFKAIYGKINAWFRLQKNRIRDRKTHIYRKCPYCKAVLRLKKIKGKHRAACPRCGKSFDVRI